MRANSVSMRISDEQLSFTNIKDVVWDILAKQAEISTPLFGVNPRFVEKSTDYDPNTKIWTARLSWMEADENDLWAKPSD